ncbi:hypothetical protein D9M71_663590 [compost metagenome]
MDPHGLFIRRWRHLYQHIAEGLAASHAVDRIAVRRDRMVIAIPQCEALGIFLGIGPQIADALDAVHRQRGVIGPENALIGVEQNNPVGQPCDDLLQLAAIGFGGQDVLAHWISTIAAA